MYRAIKTMPPLAVRQSVVVSILSILNLHFGVEFPIILTAPPGLILIKLFKFCFIVNIIPFGGAFFNYESLNLGYIKFQEN